MNTRETLIAAKGFIPTPQKWCKNAQAKTREGFLCFGNAHDAVRRCAIGALVAVVDRLPFDTDAFKLLEDVAIEMGYDDIAALNDETDFETVHAMFDTAIERAAAQSS